MTPLPTSVPLLIKQLDVEYPSSCPKASDTDREIWIKVGQRLVVERLIAGLQAAEDDGNVIHKGA